MAFFVSYESYMYTSYNFIGGDSKRFMNFFDSTSRLDSLNWEGCSKI